MNNIGNSVRVRVVRNEIDYNLMHRFPDYTLLYVNLYVLRKFIMNSIGRTVRRPIRDWTVNHVLNNFMDRIHLPAQNLVMYWFSYQVYEYISNCVQSTDYH